MCLLALALLGLALLVQSAAVPDEKKPVAELGVTEIEEQLQVG